MPTTVRAGDGTRIQLCGRLSLEIDGAQLADRLRGRQVRLLLAYLLLNRMRPVGRDELVEAMWPVSRPRSEDAALRTLLSRLRSAVGAESLTGRDEVTLTLPEPAWIDLEAAAVELARAQQALERGDARVAWALAQVPLNIASRGLLPGATAGWLESPRRDLEDMRLQALEVIGEAGLRMGSAQVGSVERSARSLIAAEPYRESGYVLLMDALAMRGNVAEGLRVFEQLRSLLRDELGTTPSPDALAAHERLLHPHVAVHGELGEGLPIAPIALPAELRDRAQAPLVGRQQELAELTRLWDAAGSGRLHRLRPEGPGGPEPRQIVVLSGEPGIGKTSLAAELARRAHDAGGVVLAGHSQEEGLAPYQPFLEALSHYIAVAPEDALVPAVREYGPELVGFIPELRRRAPELTPASPSEPESQRYRLFEAFVGLLTSIADRAPILLVLDDLHWADRSTLLLLRHLARARQPARLLILVAYRTEMAEPGLLEALADLKRERLVTELEVGGLSESETADLVHRRTAEAPSHAFARALSAATEGNPFYIEELVRNLTSAGVRAGTATATEVDRLALPEGVKEMIARRLAGLGPRTVETLRVAAVVAREFDVALVERLVDLPEEEFLRALEEALAAGVLLETGVGRAGSRAMFSHVLIREALYEGMSAPRRGRIHRRVGEALESGGESSFGLLALHFTRAAAGPEDVEKAVSYARRAGQEATEVLSHDDAARHYARALEVVRSFDPADRRLRLDLLLELGDALVRAGERPRVWGVFQEAGSLARDLGDRTAFARAAIGASRRYVQQPGTVETELIAMLEEGLDLTAGERSLERVRLLVCLCGALYFSPQRDRMTELSDEANRIADELGDPLAQAHARSARRRALWHVAHLDERLLASTEMLTLARRALDVELQLQAHAWLIVDLLEKGEADAVQAQTAAFDALADELRQPLYLWQAVVWRAMRAVLDGALDAAEALAEDALAAGGPTEGVTAPQYYAVQLMTVRREQRRMGELEQLVRTIAQRDPPRAAWSAALGTVLWETERVAEARAEFERLGAAGFADIPQDGDWMIAMALLADLCADLRDAERARTLYGLLAPYHGRQVVVGFAAVCLGPVDRLLGRLAAVAGRRDRGAAHFEAALGAAAALRSAPWLAHTQLDYAQALGGGLTASRMVEDAAATAEELGLTRAIRKAALLSSR